ncbi:EamA family transporter RarD [Saccharopolyspora sp. 6V]|uniref:EamA family transporter RarD n=1 Tax=Saccharopolyspora sp. 6V TaxID=2877239 RepID=UPI001CD64B42|nr:EamA family transporter RarD [Saccharopolyspora sp. 6V]MCA1190717.1 EamA family transporter RarD [Saccharopolyspora sp. 6V]
MERDGSERAKGTAASLAASALFGGIFLTSGLVDASAEAVFGWRVILTAAFYLALLGTRRGRAHAAAFRTALRARWWRPLAFVALSALIGLQLWLFAWAPVHEHALDASLGFLLLPIVLVIVGRLVFGAAVSRVQWIAVGIAAAAVAIRIGTTLALSWVTFVVAVGYAVYFTARKRAGLDGPAAFGGEVLLGAPFAIALVFAVPGASTPGGQAAVLAAGLAGAVAMSAYLAASGLLPMPLFGLLSYVEPVLLFAAALLLGERLDAASIGVYGLLAVALALLAADGFRGRRARPRRAELPRDAVAVSRSAARPAAPRSDRSRPAATRPKPWRRPRRRAAPRQR